MKTVAASHRPWIDRPSIGSARRLWTVGSLAVDNGAPLAGTGLLGLSKLPLGWMKMGIIHERIQPGRPQQNGRHERMHRTLKEETTRPAALTLRLQQKKFDRFRQVFNYERPHEGLNNATPGSVYQPSSVLLRKTLIEFVYPDGFILRKVNNGGDINWHCSPEWGRLRASHFDLPTHLFTASKATKHTGGEPIASQSLRWSVAGIDPNATTGCHFVF
jgi:hypothetical protein